MQRHGADGSMTEEQLEAAISWALSTGWAGTPSSSDDDEDPPPPQPPPPQPQPPQQPQLNDNLGDGAAAAAVAAEAAAAVADFLSPLLVEPPAWWQSPRDDERFAEVLYLSNMRPQQIDHYLFASVECLDRFPYVQRACWLEASTLAYLEHAWRPGGPVHSHWNELMKKRARVTVPEGPRARRQPRVSTGVWRHASGASMFTDDDGNVLAEGDAAGSERSSGRRRQG
jgi:hypothetical protein